MPKHRRLVSYCSALLLVVTCGLTAACGGDDNGSPTAPSGPPVPFSTTDLRAGTGAEVAAGSRLTVHYTGWLYSASAPENKGQQFETSVGGNPFSFTLEVELVSVQ